LVAHQGLSNFCGSNIRNRFKAAAKRTGLKNSQIITIGHMSECNQSFREGSFVFLWIHQDLRRST
jgi:hypothetical protein